MLITWKSLLVCLLVVKVTWSAPEEDEVIFIPGLDPQPDFKHYAGYLDATGGKQHFYWFVESENDPANDPVVLWLNGGPGCSSLTGKLVELGPWRVNADGSGLEWFEERWNKIANIIFMESPAGVGYSYDENLDYVSSDDLSAFHNHMAMKDFFNKFPEYSDNDFYITGESYAGFYVPLLTEQILADPDFDDSFKGFAVGNPVTDRRTMGDGLVYYTVTRGIYGFDDAELLFNECCVEENPRDCNFYDNENTACRQVVGRVNSRVWSEGLNPYNLYHTCDGGVPDDKGHISEENGVLKLVIPESIPFISKELYENYVEYFKKQVSERVTESTVPCTDATNRYVYLNSPEVREALHVPEFVHPWYFCSATVSGNYTRQYVHVRDQYYETLSRGKRILVFAGDLDMACDHFSTQWFVESLGTELTEDYHPWYYEDADEATQIGGFAINFVNMTYTTVKGAGHFVPTDMPIPSYEMWQRYIYDIPI